MSFFFFCGFLVTNYLFVIFTVLSFSEVKLAFAISSVFPLTYQVESLLLFLLSDNYVTSLEEELEKLRKENSGVLYWK